MQVPNRVRSSRLGSHLEIYMTDLSITSYSIERLIPYVRNARTHSDEQIAQIMASIAPSSVL